MRCGDDSIRLGVHWLYGPMGLQSGELIELATPSFQIHRLPPNGFPASLRPLLTSGYSPRANDWCHNHILDGLRSVEVVCPHLTQPPPGPGNGADDIRAANQLRDLSPNVRTEVAHP